MHSGLGRFFDAPLDLGVGIIEPDGNERVLPFTQHGKTLYNCEQNARMNSITFRGYSEQANLRFELNFHSPFYPQNERLCLLPVMYMELRVTWMDHIRWRSKKQPPLDKVKLFIRLNRPDTNITANDGQIDLNYNVNLDPKYIPLDDPTGDERSILADDFPRESLGQATIHERIQSINEEEQAEVYNTEHGTGLILELPVTSSNSSKKWRLIWATHTNDNILNIYDQPAKPRYMRYWDNINQVVERAIETRDENLLKSRFFEKTMEQSPMYRAHWHLTVMAFQSYLTNTFWCEFEDGSDWFSTIEGTAMFHSTVDVEYNISMLYLAIWPELLHKMLNNSAQNTTPHAPSNGCILNHDLGFGVHVNGPAYDHSMPVEENANFILMLQAYAHWIGKAGPIEKHAALVRNLANYLIWTDRDNSGFPSEGTANTIADGNQAIQYAEKQTYLAIKRVTALEAAADLLRRAGDQASADKCQNIAAEAVPKIEDAAWRGDHYVLCAAQNNHGIEDPWSNKTLTDGDLEGWDEYSLYTTNGLLLPSLIGQPLAFDKTHLALDLCSAHRETMTYYGCSHCSSDDTNVWISQNLWRDHTARYLDVSLRDATFRYWDMLSMSNTGENSFGFIDTYIGNELAFSPRGATALGYFLAGPRIIIDRLDGTYVSINPDRHRPQRWPLLPLADWTTNHCPVCVVDANGNVRIEGELEEVKILGNPPGQENENTIG